MLCQSYVLLRNDEFFCKAPHASSLDCRTCCYGVGLAAHRIRIRTFCEEAKPVILSPSKVGLDVLESMEGLSFLPAEVSPLARLVAEKATPDFRHDAGEQPLRVAFLGAKAPHKGWKIFKTLALRFVQDKRYRFYYFGCSSDSSQVEGIHNIDVHVTVEHRTAMIEAVANERIDVVVNWSLWPETFCFTVYEALAAGAYVIARSGSGNVWPVIRDNAPDQGMLVADEHALYAVFESDELGARWGSALRRRHVPQFRPGAAGWLPGDKC